MFAGLGKYIIPQRWWEWLFLAALIALAVAGQLGVMS